MLFFGAHPMLMFLWIAMRTQQTYEAHSGYCFEGSWMETVGITHACSTAHHDHHHTANQGNFGNLMVDYLGGTMDHYMQLGGKKGYIDLKKGKGFVKRME